MVNNIINLFRGDWYFILVNYDFMANNPLPEFIKGVLTIAQAFWVFQIFFFFWATNVFEPAVIPVAGVFSLRLLLETSISAF